MRHDALTLIIVRHAHRDKKKGRAIDNGLSPKGRKQARAISRVFSKFLDHQQPIILSSPKLRCIETVERLADRAGVTVETLDCLDESATEADLKRRLRVFDEILKKPRPARSVLIVSSHGDWIPAFFQQELRIDLELEKSGWALLEYFPARLVWAVQDPLMLSRK